MRKGKGNNLQCCGSGSGIRCLLPDPGWVYQDPGSGSGMNIQDHISESLETIVWVKILKYFDVDPEYFLPWIRD
jgi:hypothetical protein